MTNDSTSPNPISVSLWQKILWRVIFAALVAFASWLWIKTGYWTRALDKLSWLHIEEVRINSTWPLTPSAIRSWLPPLKNKNLLTVQAESLMALLKEKGWVDSVVIKKEYPDRISIDVQAKKARAIAVLHGQAYFIDGKGVLIGKTTPTLLKDLDLPVISWEKDAKGTGWDLSSMVQMIDVFKTRTGGQYSISQVVLNAYPYFRLFLSKPKIEVRFDLTNWESQLPLLSLLFHAPPSQVQQPRRVDLTFPKKAVLTSPQG